MKKSHYIFLFSTLVLLSSGFLHPLQAQCGNPSLSTWQNTWESCQSTPNPHPNRNLSHWIQYDLGTIHQLSTTHIWNINDPNKLDIGFRNVAVDYSQDAITWTTLGEYEFEQGTGDPVYAGFEGFDFEGKKARYVLITALSTWGSPGCAGIAEVKFNLMNTIELDKVKSEEKDTEIAEITIFPNPATNYVNIRISSSLEDEFEIQLVNPLGQRVYFSPLFLVAGENSLSISLEEFIPGIYLVVVRSIGSGEQVTRRLVVFKG